MTMVYNQFASQKLFHAGNLKPESGQGNINHKNNRYCITGKKDFSRWFPIRGRIY
jgi:hypothetical protein